MRRTNPLDPGLQIEVTHKDDDVVEGLVSAWNGSFGGAAELLLEIGELGRIAEQIKGFPRSPSDKRELILGTFFPKFAGGGASLRFHCVGGAGHAYLEAKIESGHESAGILQSAILSIPIEAAAVDSFVLELRRMDATGMGKACLGRGRTSAVTDN